MKRTIMVSILTLVMLVAFGLVGTQAKAETVKFTVTNYITKLEAIPVPDVEGHVLLLIERRGVAVFEDGSVAAYHARLMGDLTKYHGPAQGYSELTYPDGSKNMTKWQVTIEIPAGKKLPTFKGKGDYIKGTGRFEGIKGTISISGQFVTTYGKETKGDMVVDAIANYTLPSK